MVIGVIIAVLTREGGLLRGDNSTSCQMSEGQSPTTTEEKKKQNHLSALVVHYSRNSDPTKFN